jgi:hypothetical protein
MLAAVAPSGPITIALIAVAISILIGFMTSGKLRTLLIIGLWLLPLWFALWFTASYTRDIEFEFGIQWAFLWVAPLFLALWAVLTIFPFALTIKIRAIQRGC